MEKNKTQPNYLIKNIEGLTVALKTDKLPCFKGKVNDKDQIVITPYTINSAISNKPISGLNQLHLQTSLRLMNSKDTAVITRGQAKALGTDINNPEKNYVGITRINPKTKKQEVVKFYPVSKVKEIEKVKKYNQTFQKAHKEKNNPNFQRNESIIIECKETKNFAEFWGKYKTAAIVKGELICSKKAVENAKVNLAVKLNTILQTADYDKNYSIGKDLEKSYQKELRQTFPRPVQTERSKPRERRYEHSISHDGYDR